MPGEQVVLLIPTASGEGDDWVICPHQGVQLNQIVVTSPWQKPILDSAFMQKASHDLLFPGSHVPVSN